MKKTEDLSDREIQEGIYRNLRQIRQNTKTTKSFIVIFGVFVIISLVVTLWPLFKLYEG
jgi:hypothetical protein